MRPFKRPAFNVPRSTASDSQHKTKEVPESAPEPHPAAAERAEVAAPIVAVRPASSFRKPLAIANSASGKVALNQPRAIKKGASSATNSQPDSKPDDQHFVVLYLKKDNFIKKKVAKAYSDGILVLSEGNAATLYSLDNGKVVTQGRARRASLREIMPAGSNKPSKKKKKKGASGDSDDGSQDEEDEGVVRYLLGSLVVEVEKELDAASFKSGACFAAPVQYGATGQVGAVALPGAAAATAGFKRCKPKTVIATAAGGAPNQAAFRPLYDLQQPGAVLLNAGQQGAGKLAPVVIDPYLGRHLRPHQVEGVQFMYDCVMGLRSPAFTGCVLADEMGLGKTLQVITLAWTLLKQGPEGKPVASKVMVVTPATLCHNWAKEVKRWLGMERLQVFMLVAPGDTKDAVMQFKHGSVTKLCITSYETLRKHAADLEGTFDLLVCDEGHRLKAIGGNKTIDALMQLRCPRRVLLTGTPIQNNLQEFYALLSFVAPDLLGTAAAFKCVYATPIARAQERDATQDDKELGASRAAELNRKVAEVVLRRTQVILTKHLPPLTTFVLYCKPTDLQVTVYQHVLRKVLSLMASSSGMADETLGALTALKKLCNHPGLLAGDEAGSATQDKQGGPAAPRSKAAANAAAKAAVRQAQTGEGAGMAKSWVPCGLDLAKQDPTAAGKLVVLGSLLEAIAAAGERVVVVSTSTSALDLIDNLLATPRGLRTIRIDGNTGVGERQAIVDSFNNLGIGQVFFLSTRAGGAGLNLIGANHLVLYDSDWNPAADLQAMARIYRDGQKRPCSVWRLLTTGTLEEKIFQRQIMKGDLASATIASGDGPAAGRHFTQEELRRLFTLSLNTECETRDLLAGHGGASQAAVRWVDLAGLHGGPAAVASAMEACAVTAHSQAAALRAAAASKAVTAASVIHKSDEAALALASTNEHDEATGEGVGQDPAGGAGAGGDEACAAPEGRYGEEEEEAEEAVAGGKAAALAVQQLEDERPGIASKAAAGRAVAACRRRARIASSDDDDAELDD